MYEYNTFPHLTSSGACMMHDRWYGERRGSPSSLFAGEENFCGGKLSRFGQLSMQRSHQLDRVWRARKHQTEREEDFVENAQNGGRQSAQGHWQKCQFGAEYAPARRASCPCWKWEQMIEMGGGRMKVLSLEAPCLSGGWFQKGPRVVSRRVLRLTALGQI